MIEQAADLWTVPADFRVITTNGSLKKDGSAVMGRGCAREAALKYPKLPKLLGAALRRRGNRVHFFAREETGAPEGLFTFPVKHLWMEPADPTLIMESVEAFRRQVLASATYVMPRPGCGNGGLDWPLVRPLVAGLPDNVVIVHFEGERS